MYFDLILICYLSYKNGMRAKRKGQNVIAWGVASAAAYIICMVLGLYVVVFNFCKNAINLDQMSSTDIKVREAAMQQFLQVIYANPLHLITIEAFGVGGYLLIRYILDRRPDKNEPEMHWMDKIGGND